MLGNLKIAIIAHARAQNQGPRVNKKTQKKVFDELVSVDVESDNEDLVSNIKEDLFTGEKPRELKARLYPDLMKSELLDNSRLAAPPHPLLCEALDFVTVRSAIDFRY